MQSNFSFLKEKWEVLADLGASAEFNVYRDPHTTVMKLRLFAETLAKLVVASENIQEPFKTNQIDRLQLLRREGVLESELYDMFDMIRRKGNKAVHEAGYQDTEESNVLLKLSFRLATWFMEVYGDWGFVAPEYQEPQQQMPNAENTNEVTDELLDKLVQEELNKILQSSEVASDLRNQRKKRSRQFLRNHSLSEAETRVIIDEKLRHVGWEADTEKLNYYKHGTMPEKNKNKAIAEWKVAGGRVDYALFIGLKMVGVIEAKAKHKAISSVLESQTKVYAKNIVQVADEIIIQPEKEYKVPFLYATNGRKYLQQLQDESGIWFWDARKPNEYARPLEGWHSPEDLQMLLDQNDNQADEELEAEDISKFGLRPYQQKAVRSVEKGLMENQRRMLVAMATGTGKTRTAIALMYRLIKTKKCRRILFLVDRNSLGKQTEDALKDTKIEGLSFSDIYDVKSLEDMTPEVATKVQIATVQGMVRRLFYKDAEEMPSVGQYDFIIVDEAHRGYTSDREMSEDELKFKDQDDYISQYRRVIDYFDAACLGLTATPALHTTSIFGMPIYKYSYSEAVLEGYLVDHEPPYLFETELSKAGITFEKDEEVSVYNEDEEEVILEKMEDTVHFDVEQFNKRVITEPFNKAILDKLVNYIDPESKEKTLIFAATDQHADLIVRLLKQAFKERGDEVEDGYIMKITGYIYKPLEAIKRFKNERTPSIVVTVDLLTTGIDVPAITNLVFLRRVQSRILYDQMLGRATRLCTEIGKTHFNIFDAVGIYEKLQSYTEMKPVVKQQHETIGDLYHSLVQAQSEEEEHFFREQLVAKLQRRKMKLDEEGRQKFEELSNGKPLDDWVQEVHQYTSDQAKTHNILFEYVEQYHTTGEKRYISMTEDTVTNVTRGYGEGNARPEDYLDGFVQFIRENINTIPALQLVCTRPRDLTRQDLRELSTILETKGFRQSHLQTAWKQTKNEEIAADIISFIRQAALGEALVDQEVRIKNAMQKVYSMEDWTPRQKKWLDRIEKQLLQFPVLAPTPEAAFSEDPFNSSGGYNRLKKEFGEQIDAVVHVINDNLYIS
ncbi:type I restriction-modification system endonuclease [Terribacillus sp. AE2B 122]|uniref:type I restriction-modification system endonuclease n=1 Tax=Terribacillus sp. AE2B 122 TaxID=1331902 RepID=UPI00144065DB|nr:type I restriction-modification system endonuclease [Terribacillus sp. AE2B 122]VVM32902.1 Type I restriction-modification system2C restriction subunit R (EC 3.1.21.3) [Terribacillus sp. AE2B 122]